MTADERAGDASLQGGNHGSSPLAPGRAERAEKRGPAGQVERQREEVVLAAVTCHGITNFSG